jgi:hypothetical protein
MAVAQKAHPMYAARLWRMGKSIVFPLYAAVVDVLRAQPGDLFLIWVHPPFITLRLADLGAMRPIDHFQQDDLLESWRGVAEHMEVVKQ